MDAPSGQPPMSTDHCLGYLIIAAVNFEAKVMCQVRPNFGYTSPAQAGKRYADEPILRLCRGRITTYPFPVTPPYVPVL